MSGALGAGMGVGASGLAGSVGAQGASRGLGVSGASRGVGNWVALGAGRGYRGYWGYI